MIDTLDLERVPPNICAGKNNQIKTRVNSRDLPTVVGVILITRPILLSGDKVAFLANQLFGYER
jgi:hypothetical protein